MPRTIMPSARITPMEHPILARPVRGRPPVPEGPTSKSTVLVALPFLVLGRADGADPPLPQSQMTG